MKMPPELVRSGILPAYVGTAGEHGGKGFLLSSSLGLSGWILAKEMSVFDANVTLF